MRKTDQEEDHLLMTLNDLLFICKKNKATLIFASLLCGGLALLYTLTRPVEYAGESSFREKGKTAETKTSALSMFIGLPELNENAAVSLMKSRRLVEATLRKRNLQAKIAPAGFSLEPIHNIRKNLIAEYAHLTDSETPCLPDLVEGIKAHRVTYAQESPLKLNLRFPDEEHYTVFGPDGKKIGSGSIGLPFEGSSFAFTLMRVDDLPLANRSFKLTLKPISMIADELLDKIHIEPDVLDKGLLRLSFAHRNRFESFLFLNALMQTYQEYLREEHQRITGDQIAYLNKRQDDSAIKLQEMMREHAKALSENMGTIEFLFHNQQSFSQKLLMIDFELKRLDMALKEGLANYDKFGVETGDQTILNQILSEVRRYKQQSDAIDLALRNNPPEDAAARQKAFSQQVKRLEELRRHTAQVKEIAVALDSRASPSKLLEVFSVPKYMLKEWRDKLSESEQALKHASPSVKEEKRECVEACRANFLAYLSNLRRILEMEERLLQDSLAQQQKLPEEFQGINLNTASQLFVNYSKNLSDIEAEMLHYAFIIEQMKDPRFEPSSLSTVLEDPVSKEIINRAGMIALTLKDEANHSDREMERLKTDLAQQKDFLALHAQQTLQLLQLRQKLYQDKLIALQSMTRQLLQQEIALLEKNLADYISKRIANLKHEKAVIEQQQQDLRNTMQKMPDRWAAEKLIDQHLETNRKMVEEVAKLVESKNIAANIDLSQSAPIDIAILPLHPQSRKPLLFFFIGAFFGAFASLGFVLSRTISKGLPATEENLKALHQHVSGTLSKQESEPDLLLDSDLDTLRRAEACLCPSSSNEGQSLLIMLGNSRDNSSTFAHLLQKRGKKVLLLPLDFDHPSQEPGLLQFLEENAPQPKIMKKEGIDSIDSGGITRFSSELLASPKFRELLKSLSQQYDWILAVTRAAPESGEAEALFHLFQHALISITEQRVKDLKPYLHPPVNKRVSFIFTQN